jgi:hypothetical protein
MMSTLGKFLKKFDAKRPHVEALDDIPDMWRWMRPHVVDKINKISEPQSFRIALHDGWAHMWAKEYMASPDSEYFDDPPVRLVLSIPEGRPLLVCFHPHFDIEILTLVSIRLSNVRLISRICDN